MSQARFSHGNDTLLKQAGSQTQELHRAQVGSGKTALVTLLHEGGHAAHFACIDQATPLASQERAPTSVAYAENQSMFLDSLAGSPRACCARTRALL